MVNKGLFFNWLVSHVFKQASLENNVNKGHGMHHLHVINQRKNLSRRSVAKDKKHNIKTKFIYQPLVMGEIY